MTTTSAFTPARKMSATEARWLFEENNRAVEIRPAVDLFGCVTGETEARDAAWSAVNRGLTYGCVHAVDANLIDPQAVAIAEHARCCR